MSFSLKSLKDELFKLVPLHQMIQYYSAPITLLVLITFGFLVAIASTDPIKCSLSEEPLNNHPSVANAQLKDSCEQPLTEYKKAVKLYPYYFITNIILFYTLILYAAPCIGFTLYLKPDPYKTQDMPMDLISTLKGRNTPRPDESLEWFKININLSTRNNELYLYIILIILQLSVIVPSIVIHNVILNGEFLALGFYIFKPNNLSLLFPRETYCLMGLRENSIGKREQVFKICRFNRNLMYAFTHLCAWYMFIYVFCVNLFFIGQLIALSVSKERRMESMKIKLPNVPDQYIERLANDRPMFFALGDAYQAFGLANFRDYMGLIIDRYIEKSNSYNRFAIDKDDNELFKEKSLPLISSKSNIKSDSKAILSVASKSQQRLVASSKLSLSPKSQINTV